MRLIPTKMFFFFFLSGMPLAALPLLAGTPGLGVWLSFLVVFAFLLLVTPLGVRKIRKVKISLSVSSSLYTEEEDPLTLTLHSPFSFPVKARLRLEMEGPVKWEQREHPLRLEPGENLYLFSILPFRRGEVIFKEAFLRIEAPWGLVEVEKKFPLDKKVEIFPNLRGVGRFALKFYKTSEAQIGLKVDRFRGEGSEFDSLREYIPGVDIRTIDWKVSARKGKMVCREYRAEKNHQIILALDSGNLMAAEFQGLTKLDYAINSLLIIAYMAIKSGDRVGFLSFDEKVRSHIPPQGKEEVIQRIGKECARLSYDFAPTNFVVAMEYLLAQQKRRALVIVFTDFVDALSAELTKEYLGILRQRHLVLFVSIRDPYLDTFLETPPQSLVDMHKQVACCDLRKERLLLFQELQRMGIFTLDLFPSQIAIPVLNQYMEIRRKELI